MILSMKIYMLVLEWVAKCNSCEYVTLIEYTCDMNMLCMKWCMKAYGNDKCGIREMILNIMIKDYWACVAKLEIKGNW